MDAGSSFFTDIARNYLGANTSEPKKGQYDPLFDKFGEKHGVDPDLLRAMTHQESTFNPNAVSNKNAQGLMQLIPDTAKRFGVTDPFNPEQNIEGGAKYLKFLLDRYNGDVPKALAGYNAGEGAVDKYKGIPPFAETQNYVKRITGNYKGSGYLQDNPFTSLAKNYLSQPQEPLVTLAQDYLSKQDESPILTPVNDPVSEAPETIQAQAMAALNPNQTKRVGILLKPEEVSQVGDAVISQFIPVPQADGRTLFVAKTSGRKLGLKTPKDIESYVQKNGVAPLLGKVENIEDTSQGSSVLTTTPNGTELTASRVSSPEAAQAQIQADQVIHPGSTSQAVDAQDVVSQRDGKSEGTDFTPELLDKLAQGGNTADYAPLPDRTTSLPVKTAVRASIKPKQATQTSKGTTSVSVNSLTPQPDDSRVTQRPINWKVGETDELHPRGKDMTDEDILKGNEVFIIDLKGVPKDRQTSVVQQQLASRISRKYNIPLEKVLDYNLTQTHVGNSDEAEITIPRQVLAEMGGDPVKAVRGEQRDQIEPLYEKKRDEFMANQGNQIPNVTLKAAITPEDLTNFLATTGQEIGGSLGGAEGSGIGATMGGLAGSATGGALGSASRTAGTIGGILDFINDLSPTKGESMAQAIDPHIKVARPDDSFRDILKDVQETGEEAEKRMGDKGVVSQIFKIAGGAPGDLSRLALLSYLPGGAIAGMAIDSGAQTKSKGGSTTDVLKSLGHGATLGALFHFAPTVGKAADEGIATLFNGAGKNIIKEGATLATIGGGTYALARATGSSPDDAFREAVVNSAFHLTGQAPQLLGKPIRIRDTEGNIATVKVENSKVVPTEDQPVAEIYVPTPKEMDAKIAKVMENYDSEGKRIEPPTKKAVDLIRAIPENTKGGGALRKVAEELETNDPIKQLNAIQKGRTRIANLDEAPHLTELSSHLDKIESDLKKQGYEIEDLVGKPFDSGMKVEAQFVDDPSVPFGEERITGVRRPQIMKDGKMVQNAQVTVGKNYDPSTEMPEATEARLTKEKEKEDKREQMKQDLLADGKPKETIKLDTLNEIPVVKPTSKPVEAPESVPTPEKVIPASSVEKKPVEAKATLPTMKDNYLKDLSHYTPKLYRETNAESAFEIVNQNSLSKPEQLFVANTPNLAKGQGQNKGVLIEMDSQGIRGQVNTSKPGFELAYKNGEAEFQAKYIKGKTLEDNVTKVTLTPDAFKQKRGKLLETTLTRQGWERTVDGDNIVFTRPESQPVEKPTSVPSVEKDVTPVPEAKTPPTDSYGAKNKIVTLDRAQEIREALSKKLKASLNQASGGLPIDPETVRLATELGVFHAEAGLRKFSDWSKAMAKDGIDFTEDKLKAIYANIKGEYKLDGMDDIKDFVPEAKTESEKDTSPTSLRNEIVDKERIARGLEPVMKTAKREFGEAWDKAVAEIDKNPKAQDDLIRELSTKPRAVTDIENAMLLQRKADVKNQFESAAKDLLKDPTDINARAQVARTSDELSQIDRVSKAVGTETGRGLNARKMMLDEDMTLSSMETRKRAALGGRELTDPERTQLQKLADEHKETVDEYEAKIAEKDNRIAEMEAKAELQRTKLEAKAKKPVIDKAEKIAQVLNTRAEAARQRLAQRGNVFTSGLDPLALKDLAEIGASHIANVGLDFAKFSEKMIDEFTDKVKPYLEQIYKASQNYAGEAKDASRLQAFKTRTEKRITELETKLAHKDYTRKAKPAPLSLDPEAKALKVKADRIRHQFENQLKLDAQTQRTGFEKTIDAANKWERFALLSWPTTIGKLFSAAVQRMAYTPIEELTGVGIKHLVPGAKRVANLAPREGGLNVRAEAKALTEFITSGMKDAWKAITSGQSDLDIEHGKQEYPHSWTDFFGTLHGAMKAPVKRAEYARSLEKRLSSSIANGIDVADPIVQTKIMMDAYKDASRAIFMQDNKIVNAYQSFVRTLETRSKETGRPTPAGKVGTFLLKSIFPIVKIPTNFAAETFNYATGSVTGTAKLVNAWRKGIDNLSPEQADLIMRHLKKGSVGLAAGLFGFFNPNAFGGYYQPGEKRDEKDVKAGRIRMFGYDLPSWISHTPLLEVMQIGSTVRRVADSRFKKSDKDTKGIGEGLLAGAFGLADEVPFVKETLELGKLMDAKKRDDFLGELIKSRVVPGLIQQPTSMLDTDKQGNPIKRDPETIWQHIETGIPRLRQQVPIKEEKDSIGDQVRDNKMSPSDALRKIEQQKADGEISDKAYKARKRDIGKDEFQSMVSELKSTKDEDFANIEKAIEGISDEDDKNLLRMKLVKLMSSKKFAPKDQIERKKLQDLLSTLNKTSPHKLQDVVDGEIFPQRQEPEFIKHFQRRVDMETPRKFAGTRESTNVEDRRNSADYPIITQLQKRLEAHDEPAVQEILDDLSKTPLPRWAHELINTLLHNNPKVKAKQS